MQTVIERQSTEVINLAEAREDRERDAARHLLKFFKEKTRNGMSIPYDDLITQEHIYLLLDEEFDVCVEAVYRELGTLNDEPDPDGNVPWDVRYLIGVFRECARMKIPKEQAAGIALIHARFCANRKVLRKVN